MLIYPKEQMSRKTAKKAMKKPSEPEPESEPQIKICSSSGKINPIKRFIIVF